MSVLTLKQLMTNLKKKFHYGSWATRIVGTGLIKAPIIQHWITHEPHTIMATCQSYFSKRKAMNGAMPNEPNPGEKYLDLENYIYKFLLLL